MKRYIRRNQAILSMALINPPLTKQKSIRVELEQGGESPIPHVHVLLNSKGNSRNTAEIAYVRLDRAAYSTHHKGGKKMNSNQKQEFIEIMTAIWKKSYITSIIDDETVRSATGYEVAVATWIDTYGGEDKFKYDDNGFPIMPDYSRL